MEKLFNKLKVGDRFKSLNKEYIKIYLVTIFDVHSHSQLANAVKLDGDDKGNLYYFQPMAKINVS